MKRIAFVIPWYGEKIPGGAEAAARGIIQHLDNAGVELEVLTTCVKEFSYDWNTNYHKEGLTYINKIKVRRFKVRKRNTKIFDEINYKLINSHSISEMEERLFYEEMVRSDELISYIEKSKNKYDVFFFIPYMFGTTFWGSSIHPMKSVIIPCLHDESYAYMTLSKKMIENVNGLIFNSNPEMEFAQKNYDLSQTKYETIGLGIDTDVSFTRENFIKKYKINQPFILYAGRKDQGKNVNLLIKYYKKYKMQNKNTDLKLLLIGGGKFPENIEREFKNDILDFGFVSKQDKYNIMASATCLCQPSTNESFSFVIMESWLCETPVIVHNQCKVTKDFCIKSNGGLFFDNYYEFAEIIDIYLNNKHLCRELGNNGKKFIQRKFAWDIIVNKYINFIDRIVEEKK